MFVHLVRYVNTANRSLDMLNRDLTDLCAMFVNIQERSIILKREGLA